MKTRVLKILGRGWLSIFNTDSRTDEISDKQAFYTEAKVYNKQYKIISNFLKKLVFTFSESGNFAYYFEFFKKKFLNFSFLFS